MKPAQLNLPTIWRGCDWPAVVLNWKDLNGNPVDLTGWTPSAKSLRINLNAEVTDAVNGVTQLVLSKTQTAALTLGKEEWDWIWTRDSDGYKFPPFLTGTVPIKEPTTNGQ